MKSALLLIFLFGLVSLSLGIRCQACGGNKGNSKRYFFACDSDSDNGKSIECNEGFNQCWYYKVSDHGDNYTIRECGASLPEKCWKGENMNGLGPSTICNCDTDNCNKDHQCDCNNVDPDPTGLTCQVCGGELGECQDANDNGESKTCPTNAGEQVCLYIENYTAERSSVVTRRCEPKSVFGVHCKYESQGYDSSIVCT
eukprot:00349.XXX_423_1188_1 [CDS] Oithona nana genome sequencing.